MCKEEKDETIVYLLRDDAQCGHNSLRGGDAYFNRRQRRPSSSDNGQRLASLACTNAKQIRRTLAFRNAACHQRAGIMEEAPCR